MLNKEFKKFFEKNFEEFYNMYFEQIPDETFSRKSKSLLLSDLFSKLEFGLQKYGDISFQANEENLQEVDVLKHLQEEMVDAVNYILSQKIKDEFLTEDRNYDEDFHENIFRMLVFILGLLEKRKNANQ